MKHASQQRYLWRRYRKASGGRHHTCKCRPDDGDGIGQDYYQTAQQDGSLLDEFGHQR